MNVQSLILYGSSLFISCVGAWFISKFGHHFDLLDRPNDRSSHQKEIPKGGGVGILAVFAMAAIAYGLPLTFWVPATVLSVVSFFGDRFEISPFYRLMFQFAASIIFLTGIWQGPLFSSFGYFMILPFSIFIVATANYYNFMDGINGIAGITGMVGFGLLAAFIHSRGLDPGLKLFCISLSLSCLGFLPFNMPHARVFMGDVGSILLGFIFAAMVILLSKTFWMFICLSSFLLIFYVDELTTELVRFRDGEKLWTPHRRHLYQILANEYGIAHWKVSLGYGIGQLVVGVSILSFMKSGMVVVLSIIFFYFCIFTVISSVIRKRLVKQPDS